MENIGTPIQIIDTGKEEKRFRKTIENMPQN
jgi:hypothetical protein